MAITMKDFERFIEAHPMGKNHPLFIAWAYGGKTFEEMKALGDFAFLDEEDRPDEAIYTMRAADDIPDVIPDDVIMEGNVKVTDIDNSIWRQGAPIGQFMNFVSEKPGPTGQFTPKRWYE